MHATKISEPAHNIGPAGTAPDPHAPGTTDIDAPPRDRATRRTASGPAGHPANRVRASPMLTTAPHPANLAQSQPERISRAHTRARLEPEAATTPRAREPARPRSNATPLERQAATTL